MKNQRVGGRPAGLPKTGGRQRGTPNKATSEAKGLARSHGPEVIRAFVRILRSRLSTDAAKISAGKELLDRGYGRPPMAVDVGVPTPGAEAPRTRLVIFRLEDGDGNPIG